MDYLSDDMPKNQIINKPMGAVLKNESKNGGISGASPNFKGTVDTCYSSKGDSKVYKNGGTPQCISREVQFFKTKLCPFLSKGRCMNGTKCKYAHHSYELRLAPDLRCTKLCEAFIKGELCAREDCPFAHSRDDLRTSHMAFYKVNLCNFYKKGKCLNGESCRFAHGISELRGQLPTKSERKKRIKKSKSRNAEENHEAQDVESLMVEQDDTAESDDSLSQAGIWLQSESSHVAEIYRNVKKNELSYTKFASESIESEHLNEVSHYDFNECVVESKVTQMKYCEPNIEAYSNATTDPDHKEMNQVVAGADLNVNRFSVTNTCSKTNARITEDLNVEKCINEGFPHETKVKNTELSCTSEGNDGCVQPYSNCEGHQYSDSTKGSEDHKKCNIDALTACCKSSCESSQNGDRCCDTTSNCDGNAYDNDGTTVDLSPSTRSTFTTHSNSPLSVTYLSQQCVLQYPSSPVVLPHPFVLSPSYEANAVQRNETANGGSLSNWCADALITRNRSTSIDTFSNAVKDDRNNKSNTFDAVVSNRCEIQVNDNGLLCLNSMKKTSHVNVKKKMVNRELNELQVISRRNRYRENCGILNSKTGKRANVANKCFPDVLLTPPPPPPQMSARSGTCAALKNNMKKIVNEGCKRLNYSALLPSMTPPPPPPFDEKAKNSRCKASDNALLSILNKKSQATMLGCSSSATDNRNANRGNAFSKLLKNGCAAGNSMHPSFNAAASGPTTVAATPNAIGFTKVIVSDIAALSVMHAQPAEYYPQTCPGAFSLNPHSHFVKNEESSNRNGCSVSELQESRLPVACIVHHHTEQRRLLELQLSMTTNHLRENKADLKAFWELCRSTQYQD